MTRTARTARSTRNKVIAAALATALAGASFGLSGCAADMSYDLSVDNAAQQTSESSSMSMDEANLRELLTLYYSTEMSADEAAVQAKVNRALYLFKANLVPDVAYDAATGRFSIVLVTVGNTYDPEAGEGIIVYTGNVVPALKNIIARDLEDADINVSNLDASALLGTTLDFAVNVDFNGQEPLAHNFDSVSEGIYSTVIKLDGQQLMMIANGQNLPADQLPPLFASFTDEYLTTSSIKIGTSKLTNNPDVFIDTPGIITSVKLNGAEQPASCYVTLPKDGTHTIDAAISNGAAASAAITLDRKAPTVKIGSTAVKNGKTVKVKKGAVLRYYDANGVKSAKLAGKAISNKAAVKRSGKLVVTDKAGNKLTATVKFK